MYKIKDIEQKMHAIQNANNEYKMVMKHGYTFYRLFEEHIRYFAIPHKKVIVDFHAWVYYKIPNNKIEYMPERILEDIMKDIIREYNDTENNQRKRIENIVNMLIDSQNSL